MRRQHKPSCDNWPYFSLAHIPSLLGRAKRPSQLRHGVILNWLLRSGLVAKGTYITNLYKFDGIGSQLLHTLSTQAYCQAFGIAYAHTPLSRVSEKLRNFPQEQLPQWEACVKLGEGFPLAQGLDLPMVSIEDFIRLPLNWGKPCVISGVNQSVFLSKNPSAYQPAIRNLRSKHVGRVKTRSPILNVAVHIRRGDVDKERHPARYTDNEKILKAIGKIASVAYQCDLEPRMTIYSQGNRIEFADFEETGAVLELNGDPLSDFIEMQNADILVTAKSSFSYVAGLTNSFGVIIYEPWWSPPLPDWVAIESADNILLYKIRRRFGLEESQT